MKKKKTILGQGLLKGLNEALEADKKEFSHEFDDETWDYMMDTDTDNLDLEMDPTDDAF